MGSLRLDRPRLIAVAWLVLGSSAWPGCDSPRLGSGDELGPPSVAAPEARRGIRVPLPPGWEARQGGDGELRIGPTGAAPVLRISARRGQSGSAPGVEALRKLLPKDRQSRARVMKNTGSAHILTFPLEDAFSGKKGPPRVGLIGIRPMGRDWFLCAAARGLRADDELEAAVEACAGLDASGAPR